MGQGTGMAELRTQQAWKGKSVVKPSSKAVGLLLQLACAAILTAAANANAQGQNANTVQPLLWQAGMTPSEVGEINVFRRFATANRTKMVEFYRDVLGLKPLSAEALGGNAMIRYPVGHSEIKLFPVAQGAEMRSLPFEKVIGIRLLSLFYPDEASVMSRFKEHGYPAPKFQRRDDTRSTAALVQDPDGQWYELVALPGASREALNRFEVGITVSDLEQSRAFYRDFLGLPESKPVRSELLGVTKYSYRHGDMTLSIWSFGKDVPKDTNTAGLQYITWDVEGVDKIAKARNARIDRPLSAPGSPRTIWLFDPDGITNYFAQFKENNNQR
jgi:catechol 2,3-dioxygenase-like lactoylglutathione lyase family enzyme